MYHAYRVFQLISQIASRRAYTFVRITFLRFSVSPYAANPSALRNFLAGLRFRVFDTANTLLRSARASTARSFVLWALRCLATRRASASRQPQSVTSPDSRRCAATSMIEAQAHKHPHIGDRPSDTTIFHANSLPNSRPTRSACFSFRRVAAVAARRSWFALISSRCSHVKLGTHNPCAGGYAALNFLTARAHPLCFRR